MEGKVGETRIAIIPSLCRLCVALGTKVIVEKSVGLNAGFTEADYCFARARIELLR